MSATPSKSSRTTPSPGSASRRRRSRSGVRDSDLAEKHAIVDSATNPPAPVVSIGSSFVKRAPPLQLKGKREFTVYLVHVEYCGASFSVERRKGDFCSLFAALKLRYTDVVPFPVFDDTIGVREKLSKWLTDVVAAKDLGSSRYISEQS